MVVVVVVVVLLLRFKTLRLAPEESFTPVGECIRLFMGKNALAPRKQLCSIAQCPKLSLMDAAPRHSHDASSLVNIHPRTAAASHVGSVLGSKEVPRSRSCHVPGTSRVHGVTAMMDRTKLYPSELVGNE